MEPEIQNSVLQDLREGLLDILAQEGEKLLQKKKEFNDMIDELNKKPKKINEEFLWLRFSSLLEVFPEDSRSDLLERSQEEGIRCKGVMKIIDEDISARKEELESRKRRSRGTGGVRNRRGATLRRQA